MAPKRHNPLPADQAAAVFRSLVAATLGNLSRVLNLECNGQPLDRGNTWFSLGPRNGSGAADAVQLPRRHYYPLQHFRAEEPRVLLLDCLLRGCLRLGRIHGAGSESQVTGWSLRDLEHWLVNEETDPGSMLGNISWYCKVKCKFCYQIGHPPELQSPRFTTPREEIETKIRYYRPEQKQRLFHATNYDTNEILTYPGVIELMRLLREKTDKPFYNITTNGVPLTERMISDLKPLLPFELGISINSTNPALRKKLMRDKQPEVAISSMLRLREENIPFLASIVAWPEFTIEDLEQTIRDLDRIPPAEIRVCLPGYSRYFSAEPLFDRDEIWQGIVNLVRRLRGELTVPIIPLPSVYEEYLHDEFHNQPYVQGVVPGSPASRAGVRRGDVLVGANNVGLPNRPAARFAITKMHEDGISLVWLKVRREGQEIDLVLKESADSFEFPYTRHLAALHRMPYGLLLPQGLGHEVTGQIRHLAARHRAQRILILSSTLMRGPMQQILAETGGIEGAEVEWAVPENRYLGPNIFMGDLLTVQDFVDFIREHQAAGGLRPDLVLIPSSAFSTWRRDITGRTFFEIGRLTGLPVDLMQVTRIWA
jgi:NifB/MoaA-like Fe-S oxidoreductase